jgi:hypothetical protein
VGYFPLLMARFAFIKKESYFCNLSFQNRSDFNI